MYKYRKDIYYCLYFITLSLYLVGRFFEYTTWNDKFGKYFIMVKNFSYIPLALILFLAITETVALSDANLKKTHILVFLFILFCLIFVVFYNINSAFVCVGFSFCTIKIDKKKLYKFLYIFFLILITIGIVGGVGNMTTTARVFGDSRTRYAFAFAHPYSMQLIWMSVVSCQILYKESKPKKKMVCVSFITLILHLLGDTRSAFVCTVFLILFDYAYKAKSLNENVNYCNAKDFKMLCGVFAVFFLVINSLCIYRAKYVNDFIVIVDTLFTGRVSMGARYFAGVCNNSIPILPVEKNVNLEKWALGSYILDSEYSQWLFDFGLLFSSIILVFLFFVMKNAIKQKEVSIVVIFTAIALNAMMEPCILSILYNPGILLCIPILYETKGLKISYD